MTRAFHLVTALLLCAALRAQAPTGQQPPAATTTPAAPMQQPTPTQQPGAPQPTGYQDPGAPTNPVPISAEPHHRLILQNDFTHVYNVMVPPLDATLLHQHDLPYLYVTLGPAELINAVVGQPEVHLTLQDDETRYNPGHFAHLVRTDSGLPFHNISIELVRPQGTARNLCKEVMPGPPGDCPNQSVAHDAAPASRSSRKKPAPEAADDVVPYFETDEVRVDLIKISSGRDYADAAPKVHALLVALSSANLDVNLGGEHLQFLHGGDVLWMPAGTPRKVVDFLGTHSSFLLISFKDSAPRPASP